MKASRSFFAAVAAVAAALAALGAHSLNAQQPGFIRNVLQKVDLSAHGREAIQITADFPPGTTTGKHTHPGEEIGYVLEGTASFTLEGKAPVTLKAGDHFFVAAETVHEGRNAGSGKAKVLVTYIVEKGKPLATPVK